MHQFKVHIQINLVQNIMDCHLKQLLKILEFGFQGKSPEMLTLKACL